MSYYDFLKRTQLKLWRDCYDEISDEQVDLEVDCEEHTEKLSKAIQEIMNKVKPYSYAEYISHIHHATYKLSKILLRRIGLHLNDKHPEELNKLRARYKELQDLMTIHRKLLDKLVDLTDQNLKLLRDRSPTDEEKNTFDKQLENDINEMKQ
jgi:DNA repair ATPase RecN